MLPQPHGRAEAPRGEGRQRRGAEGGPGRGATLQALRELLLPLLLLGLGTLARTEALHLVIFVKYISKIHMLNGFKWYILRILGLYEISCKESSGL